MKARSGPGQPRRSGTTVPPRTACVSPRNRLIANKHPVPPVCDVQPNAPEPRKSTRPPAPQEPTTAHCPTPPYHHADQRHQRVSFTVKAFQECAGETQDVVCVVEPLSQSYPHHSRAQRSTKQSF
ncbi:unnamed protein product [Boreogadus saida]